MKLFRHYSSSACLLSSFLFEKKGQDKKPTPGEDDANRYQHRAPPFQEGYRGFVGTGRKQCSMDNACW